MDVSGDWVKVAAMALVYGLYKLDLWRRARRHAARGQVRRGASDGG